jgi:nicotinamidase-related amidase
LIDVQNEYISGRLPIEYPPLEVSLPNISRALAAAREAGLPVVVVQQMAPPTAPVFAEGSHGWELHESVCAVAPDLLVQKTLPSALAGTGLGEWLHQRGVNTLVVAGYMSQNCNESTIRQAAHEGWVVEYLHDAAGAISYCNDMGLLPARQMHEASCIVLQSRFASVMGTAQWLQLLRSGEPAPRDSLYASYRRAREQAAAAGAAP